MSAAKKRVADGKDRGAPFSQILLCLGIALIYCAMYTNRLHASDFAGNGWNVVLFSECMNLIAFAACAALYRRIERATESRPRRKGEVMLLLGAIAAAGRTLSIVGDTALLPSWLILIGVAVYSLAEPVLLLGFMVTCCREELKSLKYILPGSLAVAGFLMIVVFKVPMLAGDAIVMACPLLSAVLFGARIAVLNAERKRERIRGSVPAPASLSAVPGAELGAANDETLGSRGAADAVDTAGSADAATASDGIPGDQTLRSHPLPVWPFVLMIAYDFVFHVIMCFDTSSEPFSALGMSAVSIIALVVAVIASRKDAYSPLFLYKIATPLAVAGLMCLTVSGVWPGSVALLSNAGSAAFYLFLLITFAMLCQRREFNATRSFALLMTAEHVGHISGTVAGILIRAAAPAGGAILQASIAVITIALVALTTLLADNYEVVRLFGLVPQGMFAMGGRRASKDADGRPTENVVSVMSPCEQAAWATSRAARRYGFTIREEEVFGLMLDGLSNQQIAERLVVSPGTVKSHVSHICHKMGVASREAAVEAGASL
jgi:DNA-binding CsgD family transcriptional regulator